jgi:hypothetical protein
VACGNNNVSRSCLSSQPSGQGARNGIAERLAAGAPRTTEAAQGKKTRGYKSVRLSPQQVKSAAEKRLREAESKTSSRQYPRAKDTKKKPQYYSKTDKHQPGEDAGLVQEYFSPENDLTFDRAHVHVFHDERNDEVRLHISLGEKNRHSEKIALVGASGNEVNAAVDLLTAALKSRMS